MRLPRILVLITCYLAQPCNASDLAQRWRGTTLTLATGSIASSGGSSSSTITNAALPGQCLSSIRHDPARLVPCAGDATRWLYNPANLTIAVAAAASGTLKGKGVGACLDVNGEH